MIVIVARDERLKILQDKFTIIDLFCGTGGFVQGFLSSDPLYEVIYSLDVDKDAADTAKLNHPNAVVECSNIREIDIELLKNRLGLDEATCVIGGPPCQGFSSLRPSRGLNTQDARNNLYQYFFNFVERFNARAFVMENVVGLLTHNKGKTILQIESLALDLGFNVDWKILNTANFGVPQKRERVIMIGVKGSMKPKFPEPTHYFSGKVIGHKDKNRSITTKRSLPLFEVIEINLLPAVTAFDAISDLPSLESGEKKSNYLDGPGNAFQRARRTQSNKVELHVAANHSDKMLEVMQYAGDNISFIPKHLITSGYSSCYSRINPNEPANTITVKFQSPASSKCIHPYQNRTITPREAARIQSFDDHYKFSGSLTSIASQIGNAVPPLLGRAIGGALISAFK